MKIHQTAIVSPDAVIGEGSSIGAYSIIGRQVRIGNNTAISSHVVIEDGTEIGENCQISQYSCIGGAPQDLKFRGEVTKVVIGNFNNIREFVTINRATCEDIGVTMIGDHNLIMAYCHVAHNCLLRNNIVLANGTNLAGHVIVEDFAVVGGLTGVHQFTHIGAHSMIGGASAVNKDVPPYVTASGNHARLYGLNLIGMKRRGFSVEVLQALKDSYRIIFRSSLLLSQAVDRVRTDVPDLLEVRHFLDFIQQSKRGVCR
jgi:UDP-N-acetylglucosamine acyltransferase